MNLREKLREKTEENIRNKDKAFIEGKSILDFSQFEESPLFKLKEGTNMINIIPYIVKTKNDPRTKKGDPTYILDVWIHKNIGIKNDRFICPKMTYGKPCPICEERSKRIEQGADKDDPECRDLKATRQGIYNMIDLDEEDKGIQIFIISHFWFEQRLLKEAEEVKKETGEEITFADLEDGRIIKIRAEENTFGKWTTYEPKRIDFVKRDEPLPDSILEKAHPLDELLVVSSYEEIRDSFYAVDTEEFEEPVEKTQPEKKEEPSAKEMSKAERLMKKKLEREKKQQKQEDSLCPYKHIFGKDCEEFEECEECKKWNECFDEYNRLEKK
jgi:hypothetical protein